MQSGALLLELFDALRLLGQHRTRRECFGLAPRRLGAFFRLLQHFFERNHPPVFLCQRISRSAIIARDRGFQRRIQLPQV